MFQGERENLKRVFISLSVKLRSQHVSLNSLPPCSLLWSDESGVQGHIIAYLTVQSDCTNSAHGAHHFLALRTCCRLQAGQYLPSIIQRFSWPFEVSGAVKQVAVGTPSWRELYGKLSQVFFMTLGLRYRDRFNGHF